MEDRIVKLQASFDAIEARLKTLESCVDGAVGGGGATGPAPPGPAKSPTGAVVRAGENATVDRLQAELNAKGVSATFIRAPKEYYDETLEFRQAVLAAPSIDCLCKSIIMENTRIDEASCRADPSLIKYWLVIVQYSCPGAKKELLNKCVHGLQPSLSKKMVNMRVVAEDTSMELSGFGENAVSPVGLRTKMPIIMAKAIADLQAGVFWLGGGEVCIDTLYRRFGLRFGLRFVARLPLHVPTLSLGPRAPRSFARWTSSSASLCRISSRPTTRSWLLCTDTTRY